MQLTRAQILAAFGALSEELARRGIRGELCLFGGGAMVLAFDARPATRDIDAVFQPVQIVRECAELVAEEIGLPANWLNDGVKGWLSPQGDLVEEGLPAYSHLRILRASDRYLLAMKCLAARVVGYDTGGDRRDVEHLVRRLGLRTVEEVLAVVASYYSADRIGAKTRYFVEEIMQQLDTPPQAEH